MDSYKTRLKDITTFILDVDGVMTNGKIIYTHDGKIDRQFYAKDGYAIKYAISKGYRIAIISGGMQENVRTRLNSLGVEDVFLKAFNKIEVYEKFIEEKKIDPKNILYMGDDNPDLDVLKVVGISSCPNDASVDVKSICDYISHKDGGMGCVRDVIEQVMRIHKKWI
jgi:3-deoxy-D-manno-octulosonate 8-phosphate phosphatase (KDO 8-P phosphatase)|tara:strand:- start:171 stop:671 length:501 start_codon:yes stop_codon:yes gene_type:complete